MFLERVKCAVPVAPGAVNVGSTIALGLAPVGFRSFLAAFGGGVSAYFMLSDGAGRAISGVWTVNAGSPETATITEILQNDRLGGIAGETFSNPCSAWCERPAREVPLLRSSPMAGLRNLIINGNPFVNQRAYVSGAAVGAANTYTLDRWRVVVSGQAVSWTDSGGVRTVTAPAGGMEQVIEGITLKGGTYTLSWTGTATATVNGAAIAKGAQVTLPGGANVTVRMAGGSWSELQLEPGPIATPFEQRPYGLELALCQRYAQTILLSLQTAVVGLAAIHFNFNVPMRAAPTLLNVTAGSSSNCIIAGEAAVNNLGGTFQINAGTGGGFVVNRINLYTAEL